MTKKEFVKQSSEVLDIATRNVHLEFRADFKGEIFGEYLGDVRIGKERYAVADVWLTDSGFNGHITGTPEPVKYRVLLQKDHRQRPIPSYFNGIMPNFVIAKRNNPRIVIIKDRVDQPIHIRFDYEPTWWESFAESKVSDSQLEYDSALLKICEKSCALFVIEKK